MARTDDLSDDPSTRLSPGAAGAAGIARAALPATRRAVAADIPDLVELRRLMFEAMGSAGHADPGWQRAAAQWFERALSEPEVYGIFVSVDQGGPDGRERVCASVVGQVRDAPPAPGNPGGGDGSALGLRESLKRRCSRPAASDSRSFGTSKQLCGIIQLRRIQ